MKIPLSEITFFNGVPPRRLPGPLVTKAYAEMYYDTSLGLIGFQKRKAQGGGLEPLRFYHPASVEMTPDPEALEEVKPRRAAKENVA